MYFFVCFLAVRFFSTLAVMVLSFLSHQAHAKLKFIADYDTVPLVISPCLPVTAPLQNAATSTLVVLLAHMGQGTSSLVDDRHQNMMQTNTGCRKMSNTCSDGRCRFDRVP